MDERADAPDLVGETIAGRYRVTELIGQGGMGAVFGAVQETLDREVAIKIIRSQIREDREVVARFKREAQVVARLQHPNVVVVHDFGELEHGGFFIAMERLHGESVGDRIQRSGAFAWPVALRIVRDISAGLVAAHAAGVIHRDLKPDNIMLVNELGIDDVVKILDFGVAKLSDAESEGAPLTGSGMFVGTPGYMAPEVIFQGITGDPRSDLYALGLIWLEMLLGRPLYGGATPAAIVVQQMTNPPPDLDTEQPHHGIPAEVLALLYSLVSKDPDGRPRDALTLFRALDNLMRASSSDPFDSDATESDFSLQGPGRGAAFFVPEADVDASRIRPLSLFSPPSSVEVARPRTPHTPQTASPSLVPTVGGELRPPLFTGEISAPWTRPAHRLRQAAVAFVLSALTASLAFGGVLLARAPHGVEPDVVTEVAEAAPQPAWTIAAIAAAEIEAPPTTTTTTTTERKARVAPARSAAATRALTLSPNAEADIVVAAEESAPSTALVATTPSRPRLTSALIKRGIAEMLGAAARCTNTNIKWPESGPGLLVDHCPSYRTVSGTQRLLIRLDPAGGVVSARFADEATNLSPIGKCILESVGSWSFPAFEGDDVVEVAQKVQFTPCVPINGKCVF